MIIREFTDKDSCGKNRLYVEVSCDNCSSSFTRQKRQLNAIHGCTRKCIEILKGSSVYVNCAHCGKSVNKKKSDLAKSKSGLQFCDRHCKEEAQKYNPEIMPSHYDGGKSNYRKRALEEFGAFCNRCGYDEHIAAIQVHHKDRDRNNNELTNLEVLCANCHAIEHWACSANGNTPALHAGIEDSISSRSTMLPSSSG